MNSHKWISWTTSLSDLRKCIWKIGKSNVYMEEKKSKSSVSSPGFSLDIHSFLLGGWQTSRARILRTLSKSTLVLTLQSCLCPLSSLLYPALYFYRDLLVFWHFNLVFHLWNNFHTLIMARKELGRFVEKILNKCFCKFWNQNLWEKRETTILVFNK